ncbi:MAG TPA: cyclic 2,3-diphosphoglycerate synthase [candidate division Zixibacteria bacterium]|nr:cyclic 2,3-diphosphoglycerate synthase [candidate division Zixibacteria bacterium]
MKRVLILGAAGRDFHNFNILFRHHPECEVVAFTATQIPDIAGRTYPHALSGPFYPAGIPIFEERDLEKIIRERDVDEAVFSYSDVSYEYLMHIASRVLCAGADFRLITPESTQLQSKVPVISICAVRTGCGKSPVSRRVVHGLRHLGLHPVVVRHPMPYGELAAQHAQRFANLDDLDKNHCTIEEREEYEQHIIDGTTVYAGVDYQEILAHAEQEGDVVIWDGGNNDTSFFRSDLRIVVLDPHRAGHELLYYPGEVNFRTADLLVINKVDSASKEELNVLRNNIRTFNPKARVVEAASRVTVRRPEQVLGKRVLVIEDGPTLTHGEMAFGAGMVAARMFGASEVVDPRPYAVGSIAETFRKFKHLGAVLPAMGYSRQQRQELQQTIADTPCDLVLVATPVNLEHVLQISHPSLRVYYDVEETSLLTLTNVLEEFARDCELRNMPAVRV